MSIGGVTATEIERAECLALLSAHAVGRLCVMDDGYPAAFPVNYRFVLESADTPVVITRVRSGGVLDAVGTRATFQLDSVKPMNETGWSVLARGTLRDGNANDAPDWLRYWNPRPWVGPRDRWLYLPIHHITGRRLAAADIHPAHQDIGYL
jgi:uncharacterized protein